MEKAVRTIHVKHQSYGSAAQVYVELLRDEAFIVASSVSFVFKQKGLKATSAKTVITALSHTAPSLVLLLFFSPQSVPSPMPQLELHKI